MVIKNAFYLLKLLLILKNPIWLVSMSLAGMQTLIWHPHEESQVCVELATLTHTTHPHYTHGHGVLECW